MKRHQLGTLNTNPESKKRVGMDSVVRFHVCLNNVFVNCSVYQEEASGAAIFVNRTARGKVWSMQKIKQYKIKKSQKDKFDRLP